MNPSSSVTSSPSPDGPAPGSGRRRSLPTGVAVAALLVASVAGVALLAGERPHGVSTGSPAAESHLPGAATTRADPTWPGSSAAETPPGAETAGFVTAPGLPHVHGTGGPLRRYRVSVEAAAGHDAQSFADAVDATLADPRSWIASGSLRLQRVAGPEPADFTIYLATPDTSERMCATGGLSTAGYTSCRLPGQVIINLDRWLTAVPDYGAPLSVYRAYVVNHEVGHELGELHEACPGPGRPAPVMQQQTYGLTGCVANAWPYLAGRRYAGDLIP